MYGELWDKYKSRKTALLVALEWGASQSTWHSCEGGIIPGHCLVAIR